MEEILRPQGSTRKAAVRTAAADRTIPTPDVDETWGTDMAAVASGDGQAAVFIAVAHSSGESTGILASTAATRHQALKPIRQAARRSFGSFGKDVAQDLWIRHDQGRRYMSRDFHLKIRFPGAESFPAFVRAPEGNGCAERFIRTLTENLPWVRWLDTIEDLRKALLEFQRTHHEHWLIGRQGHRPTAAIGREHTINMLGAAQAQFGA